MMNTYHEFASNQGTVMLYSFSHSSLRSLDGLPILSLNLQFKVLKPLGDRVLVKIQNVEEKTTGGILLPTTAQSKPQGGEVVEVGEGKVIGDKKIETSVTVRIPPSKFVDYLFVTPSALMN